MPRGFHYQRRSPEQWAERANRKSNIEGFLKDEVKFFKPEKGENQIRILPPTWPDATHFGYTVWLHYGVGPDKKATVICPMKMQGKPCPVCQERARAEKDPEVDEQELKDMRPNERVVLYLLNRKAAREDRATPLAWAISTNQDSEINKHAKDRTTGEVLEVDNPDEGYDIFFDKEGEKLLTRYRGWALDRRPSSVPKSALEWITENPISEMLIWRTYEEIQAVMEGNSTDATVEARSPRGRDDDDRPSRRARDEDDDRPSRRSRVRDDDEEGPPPGRFDDEEPAPRRSSRRDEDDDDRPSRRARADDDDRPSRRSRDEDDDDRPSRRSRRDEDEDDAPRSRSSRRDEDDDDRPSRRSRDEDDDDRPSARGQERGSRSRRGDDEEEAERPARRETRRPSDDDRPARAKLRRDEEPEPEPEPEEPPARTRAAALRDQVASRRR